MMIKEVRFGVRQRCPVCGSSDGLAVDQCNGKQLFHCHANKCDVVGWMKERRLWPGSAIPQPNREWDPPNPKYEDYRRLRKALAILRAAEWADAGQPTPYLQSRGICVVPENARLMPASVSRKALGKGYPAMILPVRDKLGNLRGAQATLLTRDSKQRIKGHKRSFGPIGGGYVQLAEVDPNRPLLVGEGVESVLSAMHISGLPGIATLGTSGMKTINVPACSEIIICADNGKPGREAAKALADRVAGRIPVRIAPPPKGTGDWNDALVAARTDTSELKRKIIKARKQRACPKLRALTAEEFMDLDIEPTQHFLAPILPVAGATVFSGPKGNGKTRVVLSIAETIATGGEMLDWVSQRSGRVLYIDGELAEGLVKRRLERLKPTGGRLFVLSRYQQKNAGVKMSKLTDPALRDEIDRLVEDNEIDVIILDSFSSLIGESENDIEYWPAIEDWVMEHRGRGRGILLVMHEGVTTGRARGLTRIRDNFDNVMRVEQVVEKNADDPDYFHFLVELLLLREEEDVASERRQIARIPRTGRMDWEFVESMQPQRPGGRGGRNRARDEAIREAHASGTHVEELMEEHGLSRERIRQIVRAQA